MSQLDNLSFVTELDPKDMYGLVLDFPDQCRRALKIARQTDVFLGDFKPANVVLTGLGGSAAGGDFMRVLMDAFSDVPFAVNRDYTLPNYVGKGTLVICSSYSGNTEETLSAYADAKKRGASIVAHTSGGKLAEMARADGYPVIQITAGQPPRTALGYMLIPGIYLLETCGLLPAQNYEAAFAELDCCAADYRVEVPFGSNPMKQLAQTLGGKVANIYGVGAGPGVVANRWKGQINENAKNLAFANTYPELNHNEVLGWMKSSLQNSQWHVVVLRDGQESAKMATRDRVTRELIKTPATDVFARGEDLLTRLLTLAYMADFVSLYLAALNRVDPENIDAINILKAELAKVD